MSVSKKVEFNGVSISEEKVFIGVRVYKDVLDRLHIEAKNAGFPDLTSYLNKFFVDHFKGMGLMKKL